MTKLRTKTALGIGFAAGVVVTAASGAWKGAPKPFGAESSGQWAGSDDDGDGRYDRAVVIRGGVPSAIWHDDDRDGIYDRFQRIDAVRGELHELVDRDADGFPDETAFESASLSWRAPFDSGRARPTRLPIR